MEYWYERGVLYQPWWTVDLIDFYRVEASDLDWANNPSIKLGNYYIGIPNQISNQAGKMLIRLIIVRRLVVKTGLYSSYYARYFNYDRPRKVSS